MTRKLPTNRIREQIEASNKFARYEKGKNNGKYYNHRGESVRIPQKDEVRESVYYAVIRRAKMIGLLVLLVALFVAVMVMV